MKQSIFYILVAVATMLIITACSKKTMEMEVAETSEKKFYYGGIYNACDFDPEIFMSIDTLKKYCARNNSLENLLNTNTIAQANFTAALKCQSTSTFNENLITSNDYENPISNENNWDFKISMGADGYQLKWKEAPLLMRPVQVETGFRERGKYPFMQFYNGYEVKICGLQTITVLFFNAWVGGCLHDYYVWELVEKQ